MPRKELPTIPNLGPQTTEIRIPIGEMNEPGDYIFLVYGVEGSPDSSVALEWARNHHNRPIFEKNKKNSFPTGKAIVFDNTPYSFDARFGAPTDARSATTNAERRLKQGIMISGVKEQYPVCHRWDGTRWQLEERLQQIERHAIESVNSIIGNHIWFFIGHGFSSPFAGKALICHENECALCDSDVTLANLKQTSGGYSNAESLEQIANIPLNLHAVIILACDSGGRALQPGSSGLRRFFTSPQPNNYNRPRAQHVITFNGNIPIGHSIEFSNAFFSNWQQQDIPHFIGPLVTRISSSKWIGALDPQQNLEGWLFYNDLPVKP